MTGVGFIALFGLSFVLFPCQGQIISPPDGTQLTFLNGSNATITWVFNDRIADVDSRVWRFVCRDGSASTKRLARIIDNEEPEIYESGLSGITVIKPATLILKNVNQTYNGTYRFIFVARFSVDTSDVVVFIAIAPKATVNCFRTNTLNTSDNFSCECKGQRGNPPANVTWYKGNEQIGETGKEEQLLRLSNVDKKDGGIYRCEAKSHEQAKNEISIELIVNYPPEGRYFKEKAVAGESFTISCESNGHPAPSYTIIHNDTKVVSNEKMYTIDVVQYNHAGFYKCIAKNKPGTWSMIYNLSIIEPSILPTITTTNQNFTTSKNSGPANTAANKEDDGTTVVVWHIVVSLVSGFIIGILLSYIVSCSRRRWFGNRKPERNREAQTTKVDTTYQELNLTKMNAEDNYQSLRNKKPERHPEAQTAEADTTYQELDLSKMNTEDNYQSLRVNAASNDAAANGEESAYTELSKTRDVEDNYQSLT